MYLLLPLILLIAGAYVAFLVGRDGKKDSNMPAIVTTIFSLLALIVSGILALAWVDFSNGATEYMGSSTHGSRVLLSPLMKRVHRQIFQLLILQVYTKTEVKKLQLQVLIYSVVLLKLVVLPEL